MLRWRSQAAKSIRQTLRSAGRGPLPIERSLHLGNSSWLGHDSVFNVSDAFDFNSDDTPALQIDGRQPRGADPRWGTRRENIARFKGEYRRKFLDHLRVAIEKFAGVAILAQFPVDPGSQGKRMSIGKLVQGHDPRAYRAVRIE